MEIERPSAPCVERDASATPNSIAFGDAEIGFGYAEKVFLEMRLTNVRAK